MKLPLKYFDLSNAPANIKYYNSDTNTLVLVPGLIWNKVTCENIPYSSAIRVFDLSSPKAVYNFNVSSAEQWLKGALENDDFCRAQYANIQEKYTFENEGYYYVTTGKATSNLDPVLVCETTLDHYIRFVKSNFWSRLAASLSHLNVRIFNIKRVSTLDPYAFDQIPQHLTTYLSPVLSILLVPGSVWNYAMENRDSGVLTGVHKFNLDGKVVYHLLNTNDYTQWITNTVRKPEFQNIPSCITVKDSHIINTQSKIDADKTSIVDQSKDGIQIKIPMFCYKCSVISDKCHYCETCKCTLCEGCWDELHSFSL